MIKKRFKPNHIEFLEMYHKGYSDRKLAKLLKTRHQTIKRYRLKHNLRNNTELKKEAGLCAKCGKNPKRYEHQSYCQECHNNECKNYYKRYKKELNARNIERAHEKREYIRLRKNSPCMDCEDTFHFSSMDFHHRDPTKKFKCLGYMWRFSLVKIQEEIDKCDLLCSNCHRKREFDKQQLKVSFRNLKANKS